ncbi:peptide deformylase [Streptomyces aureoversilis]|uniref:Peptide deformylase n=1 Tax=Streptomyces aureoversilis TaxID=67277 RepID=A0ABW0ABR7_9ACTN
MSIVGPQVGIGRAAAVVQPADLPPRRSSCSPAYHLLIGGKDEQYEGCSSFFDVRGMVPWPLMTTVAATALDGTDVTTVYERGIARLVAHEMDHLGGLFHIARMRPGVEPIPVEECWQTGRAWACEQ